MKFQTLLVHTYHNHTAKNHTLSKLLNSQLSLLKIILTIFTHASCTKNLKFKSQVNQI